jgi:hypothetical protein
MKKTTEQLKMANKLTFQFNGITLEPKDDSLFPLNIFYEMAGRPSNKEPRQWKRLPHTQELLSQICKELNVELSHLIKSKSGKGGGTLAHWKLALDYAGYLSVELRSAYYDWIRQFLEEEANPDLKVHRAIEKYRKQGKSEKWIEERIGTIQTRYKFTDTLRSHGVTEPNQYAQCTNAINRPVLGGSAMEIKQERGLAKSKSLRDSLSGVELAALKLAEALAEENIETENLQGFKPCRKACSAAGDRVKRVFD